MITIAGVLVKQDGKYLLVQETLAYVYGLWNIPAGHVDTGETNDQAAKREAKEETGYDVEIIDDPQIFTFPDREIEIYVYPAKVVGGKISINLEEVLDVKWLSPKETQKIHLREPRFKDLFT